MAKIQSKICWNKGAEHTSSRSYVVITDEHITKYCYSGNKPRVWGGCEDFAQRQPLPHRLLPVLFGVEKTKKKDHNQEEKRDVVTYYLQKYKRAKHDHLLSSSSSEDTRRLSH